MFTPAQCLAKAADLEHRAAETLPRDLQDEWAEMALQWRRLAARAELQDRRAAALARETP